MLQNAYLLAKIGADTAENERNFAEHLQLFAFSAKSKTSGEASEAVPALRELDGEAEEVQPPGGGRDLHASNFCFFEKLSGVRILTTFISLKTITDGSLLSL